MTVVVDINVMLDVFQKRQPHYGASAALMNLVMNGALRGICPSHALTTLYYLAHRHGTRNDAESAVDQVLQHFEIVALEHKDWKIVRGSCISDFEDAAVSVTAEKMNAAFIVTRNESDFAKSPTRAISPTVFLARFTAQS